MGSPYDSIAGLYERFWSDWYLPAALPALQRLFFDKVPRGWQILDVCCGCGHVTAELVRRGYQVTGIDLSAELIQLARQSVPEATFLVQDVRRLDLPMRYDAALSTFDALNHLLSLNELEQAFAAIHGVLKRDSLFLFDMNVEEAYALDLKQWNVHKEDDSVSLLRGTFDPISKLGETELIWFRRTSAENWERRTSVVQERCYSRTEIVHALQQAGFRDIEAVSACDAGMSAELGYGRIMVTARTR